MSDNVAKTIHIQAWVDAVELAETVLLMESYNLPANRLSDIVRFALGLLHEKAVTVGVPLFENSSTALNFLKRKGLLREQSARAVRAIVKTLVEEDRRAEQLSGLIESFSRPTPTPADTPTLVSHPPGTVKEEE